ncbi:cytochrome b5-like heme/steroid binding domain-containing protein, partial [Colletotrichum cereale]
PVPNRGPSAASSSLGASLAPPPSHSVKAPKPTRKVILTPGHSPLDWARISGPNADLRNLPADTPYLKVTPSLLKTMTGRKGKDAWMALGGRVYNITPYLPYHPAGVPELLRGAGRDGTKLFGEIHPWVNYETMLSACLVGLLVEEDEGSRPSAMDEMD